MALVARAPWAEAAEMIGRRVASFSELERAGDYCGPVEIEGEADRTTCWFLLPVSRDGSTEPGALSTHRVTFPAHTYRECADGSLEIRASIVCYGTRSAPDQEHAPVIWHGFLDEGHVWRTA